jgi:hypothetical protein
MLSRMKLSRPIALATIAALAAACAPHTYRADVGAMYLQANGKISLQDSGGSLVLFDNTNDVDTNLGLGDAQGSPYVRLQADWPRHRVRLHGFGIDNDGSGTLAGQFGDIAAGTPVTTSLRFFDVNAAWSYDLLDHEKLRLGVGAELAFYSLDIAARSASGREDVSTDTLVPMPYGDIEYRLDPVTLGANAGLMVADLGDAYGRYWDVEASARVDVTDSIDVMAGFRYILIDAYGTASERDFDADLYFNGWFFGGGVRF